MKINNAEIIVDTFYDNQHKRAIVFRIWLPVFTNDGDFMSVKLVSESGICYSDINLN